MSMHPSGGARRLTVLSPRLLWIPWIALIASAAPATAQTVTGKVQGESATEPIRGAVVTLLNEQGERVGSALTNQRGAFSIALPGAGPFRLRAEMIGRRTTLSEPFTAAEVAGLVTISLAAEPIALDGVEVRAASRCEAAGDAAVATLRVWEEVQKALRNETVTRQLGLYEFHLSRARRSLDPRTYRRLSETRSEARTVAAAPFTTLPPEQIADSGYARKRGGQTVIYGPNTEVLLSPGFQETHCFSLKTHGRRPGQVGLAFKPVSGRKVTDIEGVLWMDATTGELDRLEFKYKRIPYGLALGEYSGWVQFQRLESGAWIIGSWRLTTPGNEEEAEVLSLEPTASRAVTEETDGGAACADAPAGEPTLAAAGRGAGAAPGAGAQPPGPSGCNQGARPARPR